MTDLSELHQTSFCQFYCFRLSTNCFCVCVCARQQGAQFNTFTLLRPLNSSRPQYNTCSFRRRQIFCNRFVSGVHYVLIGAELSRVVTSCDSQLRLWRFIKSRSFGLFAEMKQKYEKFNYFEARPVNKNLPPLFLTSYSTSLLFMSSIVAISFSNPSAIFESVLFSSGAGP